MEKSNINSRQIQSNSRFLEKDLLSFSVQNYTAEECTMIWNGTSRKLPAPGLLNGTPVPVPFVCEYHGCTFEATIDIEFRAGIGNVIIDFVTLNGCK